MKGSENILKSDQSGSRTTPSAEDRARLRHAHGRLRAASKELEGLVATEAVRGRWEPEPPPAEILEVARAGLRQAYDDLVRCQDAILGPAVEAA